MTYCYTNAFGDTICEDSGWRKWGRWVLLGVTLAFMIAFVAGFVAFSYISSRRRAKAGLRPVYGTGWAAPPPYQVRDPHPEAGKRVSEESELPDYAPPRPGAATGPVVA
ncbi:hypothetical protein CLAFUW4_00084 [Fulvia fulva]|uniref:Uncharacterized protein n=1 Tax=Passalora fulva TaxID=5499 RepID=A0A9Q8L6P4_PASFU|nr:uncharacterized protein CLAFUR5_00082 [Fulvia fulva]KAK4635068.1 hypothetical protein CLAFUR4_00084 [Fulvia fulva]KAK4638371.1 hypothetical protein CLAFUR0_00083 [Fulvia fulva]UJO11872.1 hypothetical protein CLAFUR5_00082 [Fulvia fulva]WPV09937.1 hypothetical protein CLAFUW4_00084 [Fulvia fulva]WPV23224.1 hypothetical protein CLAFUW7_00084 [Fulvia fulva]